MRSDQISVKGIIFLDRFILLFGFVLHGFNQGYKIVLITANHRTNLVVNFRTPEAKIIELGVEDEVQHCFRIVVFSILIALFSEFTLSINMYMVHDK